MTTRTAIYREVIEHPAAWTRASMGPDAKSKIAVRLGPEHLRAFDALLEQTGQLAPHAVTREHLKDAVLADLARQIEHVLADGVGLLVLQGIDRARYSDEEFERITWALGTFLGTAARQNSKGDRITHVTRDPNHPTERGYRGSGELSPHTDAYAILWLTCLQRSESGGVSHAASALAIHNEILRTHPEMLEPLYRGTRYASLDARGTPVQPTRAEVPLFSNVDGRISVFFSRQNSSEAVRQTGVPLEPGFAAAAEQFERLAQDPRFRIEFTLEPGEMMLVNNYVLVHARTEFQDSPQHKRDLLRLWLSNDALRPVIPEMHLFAQIYDDIFKLQAASAS